MENDLCPEDFCCDRGKYYQEECVCDSGFFGANCQQHIEELQTPQYFTFIGLFCVFFSYAFLSSVRQMFKQMFDKNAPVEQKIAGHQGILRLITEKYFSILISSPVNIILSLSILLSLLKLIWLILDPFQLYKGKYIIIEHILSDIVYTLLFYIYGYLLMAWYSMYDEISFAQQSYKFIELKENMLKTQNIFENNHYITDPNKRESRTMIFPYYKQSVKLRLLLVLLVQLTVSIFNGLRKEIEYPNFITCCYCFLLLNFFLLSGEFAIYGYKLSNCISNQLSICKETKNHRILKIKTIKEQLQKQVLEKRSILTPPELDVSQSDQADEVKNRKASIEEDQKRMIQKEQQQQQQSIFCRDQQKRLRKKNVTFCEMNQNIQFRRRESHHHLAIGIDEQNEMSDQPENFEGQLHNCSPPQINDSCCLQDTAKELDWDTNMRDQSIVDEVNQKKLKTVRKVKERLQRDSADKAEHSATLNKKSIDISNNDISCEISQNQQTQITMQMIEVYEYQKILEKQQFAQKQSNLGKDKQIIKQITLIVSIGIILSILFGIMSIIGLTTKVIYKEPISTIIFLYISSTLQFFSLIIVLKLFRNVQNQQIKNLIWIQKIGSKKNSINQNYSFVIPEDFKSQDEMLQKFESRINLITLY